MTEKSQLELVREWARKNKGRKITLRKAEERAVHKRQTAKVLRFTPRPKAK